MHLALEDLRILDLTRVLAGPFATMVLGDLGADVVKIEAPIKGDDARAYPPYVHGESVYFMSLNRNKRSMVLDLKSAAGKQVFLDLVGHADVVLENYRPGTMARLGLGYDTLRQINPRLIYAATSGFGQSGPYSQRAAYDAVIQAMGGIMSLTGPEGGQPTRVGTSIADITAGLFTVIGILAALYARGESGQGQMVDVAMLDSLVAILENAIARYTTTGEVPAPLGNRHPAIFPFEPFATADGQIMVAAGNYELWKRLCNVLGIPQLATDPRFASNGLRHDHHAEMREALQAAFASRTTSELQPLLDAAGVPNGPINDIRDVVRDPQLLAREMLVTVTHPVAGELQLPGVPIKMSDTPGHIRRHAPTLGQHTEQVLAVWLGMTEQQIEELRAAGAFGSTA